MTTSSSFPPGARHLTVPLSSAEEAHIGAFIDARPTWQTCFLSERVYDESEGSRTHKYPKPHPYIIGMQETLRIVRELSPCSVLDIGSPLVQNVALSCMPGVDVTVLDVRPHDDADKLGLKWHTTTATAMPYPDASWSVVTSLWVMGHVGDGRYGDAFDVDGDRKMLSEIARILKPGGVAIIGPGLVSAHCGNIFNLHRIYSWEWLLEEFERVGLAVMDQRDLPVSNEVFIDSDKDAMLVGRRDGNYGLALLTK